jgi:hypothetical protein
MVLVAVQLGPLVLLDGVLDGQGVQPKLLGDDRQILLVGLAQVQPHHRVRLLEVVGDLGGREVLGFQHPLSVQPRVTHATRLSPRGRDPGRVHGLHVGQSDLFALAWNGLTVCPTGGIGSFDTCTASLGGGRRLGWVRGW